MGGVPQARWEERGHVGGRKRVQGVGIAVCVRRASTGKRKKGNQTPGLPQGKRDSGGRGNCVRKKRCVSGAKTVGGAVASSLRENVKGAIVWGL